MNALSAGKGRPDPSAKSAPGRAALEVHRQQTSPNGEACIEPSAAHRVLSRAPDAIVLDPLLAVGSTCGSTTGRPSPHRYRTAGETTDRAAAAGKRFTVPCSTRPLTTTFRRRHDHHQGHEQLRDDMAALSNAMSDLRLHIRALEAKYHDGMPCAG